MSCRGASPPTADAAGPKAGLMVAAILLSAVTMLGSATIIATIAAGKAPDRSGKLLAVFPAASSERSIFDAVIDANGKIMATTFVPGVVEVIGDDADFSKRLLDRGAWLVLPQPGRYLTVGGCSYLSLEDYDREGGKLYAGPM